LFAGGEPLTLHLYEKNGFLPDWGEVSNRDLSRVKMVYINYPNNPTSAVCDLKFFNETVSFAKKHNIIVCHDNAYSELYEGNNKPISFLKANGSMDVGIEFHSLSKTFNMTGWRIGFVCGNKKVIAALAKIKSNLDSGVFTAIQIAGASALKGSAAVTKKMNKVYRDRRSALVCGLQKLGFDVFTPKATFYVWCRMPSKLAGSMQCCKKLLEECGIVATPGTGFGSFGEGYIRFALTVPVPRIKEALKRMKGVL
jgi:LL-diaminopimelate aminotransferase